ncbi:rubredoxin (plasmid) [Nitrobacteraceae bacterium UC4446_H13]
MSSDFSRPHTIDTAAYKTWLCVLCGLIYREEDGWPADGIVPGTRWADVPDDWACPDCGACKSDFEMVEI